VLQLNRLIVRRNMLAIQPFDILHIRLSTPAIRDTFVLMAKANRCTKEQFIRFQVPASVKINSAIF
jgi:hypothetical protein